MSTSEFLSLVFKTKALVHSLLRQTKVPPTEVRKDEVTQVVQTLSRLLDALLHGYPAVMIVQSFVQTTKRLMRVTLQLVALRRQQVLNPNDTDIMESCTKQIEEFNRMLTSFQYDLRSIFAYGEKHFNNTGKKSSPKSKSNLSGNNKDNISSSLSSPTVRATSPGNLKMPNTPPAVRPTVSATPQLPPQQKIVKSPAGTTRKHPAMSQPQSPTQQTQSVQSVQSPSVQLPSVHSQPHSPTQQQVRQKGYSNPANPTSKSLSTGSPTGNSSSIQSGIPNEGTTRSKSRDSEKKKKKPISGSLGNSGISGRSNSSGTHSRKEFPESPKNSIENNVKGISPRTGSNSDNTRHNRSEINDQNNRRPVSSGNNNRSKEVTRKADRSPTVGSSQRDGTTRVDTTPRKPELDRSMTVGTKLNSSGENSSKAPPKKITATDFLVAKAKQPKRPSALQRRSSMPQLGGGPNSPDFTNIDNLNVDGQHGIQESHYDPQLYTKAQQHIICGNLIGFSEALDEIGNVNMSSPEEQNNTLLHWCVLYNNVHMAKLLLERGARELSNSLGKTPLELAKDMCEAGDFGFIDMKNTLQEGVLRRGRKRST